MAKQQKLFRNLKSIAGLALIGLGTFLLYNHLAEAAAQLSRLLGISAGAANTLGVLIAVGLAASHALHAYFFDHQQFLRDLYHILISFWPVLVVIGGTVFLRHSQIGETKEPCQKIAAHPVDFAVPGSTCK
jgi:hypothetical protein